MDTRRHVRGASFRQMVTVRTAVLALAAVASGCASTGATPEPFPRPGSTPRAAAAPAAPGIVATALSLRGVPYRAGGTSPSSGFDCSGLVAYVLARHEIAAPRTVSAQFRMGRAVGRRSVEPGDLVFFRTEGRGPSHVGIAISRDEFVHAPASRGVVRVEPLGARYWASRYAGARRVEGSP